MLALVVFYGVFDVRSDGPAIMEGARIGPFLCIHLESEGEANGERRPCACHRKLHLVGSGIGDTGAIALSKSLEVNIGLQVFGQSVRLFSHRMQLFHKHVDRKCLPNR